MIAWRSDARQEGGVSIQLRVYVDQGREDEWEMEKAAKSNQPRRSCRRESDADSPYRTLGEKQFREQDRLMAREGERAVAGRTLVPARSPDDPGIHR